MMTTDWWDIAPLGWENILVCLVCGTLVGLERQLRGKPVGIRTSSLIILGTYCFLAIGAAVSPESADRARVLGQLITGIGFLGAGVMMTRDGQVLGVTSAATVWMLAALGALIGMQMLHQAVLLTGVTLAILVGVDYLETSFKSLRRGVHNRLESWRHGNGHAPATNAHQEELGSGIEK
ncbi:MgtC/SapB family protein [Aeromonas hydrophila]|uniref:MgtC/SapB family protein n=1 Tax=Aeromonas hydrophila TaxID=644 RepID=UPI00256F1F25|nr:MgtC/SapB family protein [Aeromonas hydrophila]MDL5382604.1 MgtC/SapB family protein [Aeromonas hydrophila]